MRSNQTSAGAAATTTFMTSASVDGAMVPLLRFYALYGANVGGGGHRSMPLNTENDSMNAGAEGGLVMVSTVPDAGLHAIYTCVQNITTTTAPYTSYMRHFSSGDPGCEGNERLPGFFGGTQYYLSDAPTAEMSRPLYRCLNPADGDHLDTTNAGECTAAEYNVEGVLGFGG